MKPTRNLLTGLAVLFSTLSATAASAREPGPSLPDPFIARYEVIYRGVRAGESVFELERLAGTRFRYVSRSNAKGLFRLAFGNEILQSSVGEVVDGRVRPVEFRGDDGSAETEKDVNLSFDWAGGKLKGIQEDRPVDVALVPDIQDALSAQLSLMRSARTGEAPRDYQLFNDGHFDTYRSVAEGSARVETPAGSFETVVFRSKRDGAKHAIRIWLAPSLGYVPVQAEQLREGKRVWIMRARSIDVSADGATSR